MGLIASLLLKTGKVGSFILSHEPQIERAVGIGLYAGSIFTTYRATVKQDEIKESYEISMADIEVFKQDHPEVAESDYKADRARVTRKMVKDTVLNWLPTALCFAGGTACFLRSTHVLTKRWLVSAALAELRGDRLEKLEKNIKATLGEEKTKEIMSGKVKKEGTNEVEKLPGGEIKKPLRIWISEDTVEKTMFFDKSSHDYNVYTWEEVDRVAMSKLNAYNHVWLCDFLRDCGLAHWLEQEKEVWIPDPVTGTKKKQLIKNKVYYHHDGFLLDTKGGSIPSNGHILRIVDNEEAEANPEDFVYPTRDHGFWIEIFYEENILEKMVAFDESRDKAIDSAAARTIKGVA